MKKSLFQFANNGLAGIVIAIALLVSSPAVAQQKIIHKIIVEGTQRIEPETVRSYMTVHEGDSIDSSSINSSLKSLFSTGLFADVTFGFEGDDLIVKVVENPIINQRIFEGNKRIKDEVLEDEVQLRPRSIYTRSKVQNDVQRLIEVYRRSGRFAVTIEPKVIQRPQNRVDLVFEINEGATTYVRSISIVGNKDFSDASLKEKMLTKEERWYRMFTVNDTYDPDRLAYDKELLRRFYTRKGYADFRVASAVAELSSDRKSFFITITVDEGKRYRFNELDISVTLPELDAADLFKHMDFSKGDWYNADKVEDTIQKLTDAAGSLGYAFVDVSTDIHHDREQSLLDVTFKINEGPRVFVDRIEINGNVRTLDKVIRREFRLSEGDAFNTAKLRRSRQRIRDLNFFENVDVTALPSPDAPDKTTINVDVEEKSTGELSFGLGWSTNDGALVEAGIHERNLLGKGQKLSFVASVAQKRTEFDVSFTEPYFMDRNLAAGIDFFHITQDFQSQSSYDKVTKGGSLRLGFDYTEELSQGLRYTIRQDKITNIQVEASEYIHSQQKTSVLSMVGQSVFYDKRDSKIKPTEGYYASFSTDVAGLGGDLSFLRNDVGTGKFISFEDDWVLGLLAKAGFIVGINDDVNINYRYFLGGDSLRGFQPGGVGAMDKLSGDALGGNWRSTATAQLTFPLGLPSELGVTGKIFSDAGVIGKPENMIAKYVDYSATPRVSAGGGIVWRSPMGPINIDLAVPLVREDYDKTEFFRLNFGARF